jgi:hypothetical protein
MTLRLARDHVGLGVGPNGYMDEIGRYETTAWAHGAGSHGSILNSPHSWPLQLTADAGVLGLGLAVALAVVVVRVALRAARGPLADDLTPGLVAAVLAYGAGLLVNFTIVGSTAPAAFLLGALVAPAPALIPSGRRHVQRAAVLVAAAAVALTASASVAEVAFTRGVRLVLEGRHDAGTGDVAWATRLRPWDHDIDTLASNALATSTAPGAQQAARGYAERSQRATPGTYRSAIALAIGDNLAHRYPEALTRLDAIVDTHPARALPLVQRGIAEIGLGRLDAARRDLRHAQRLAPYDSTVRALLEDVRH